MKRFILFLFVGIVCVSCVNELEDIRVDNEIEEPCLNDLLNLSDGVVIGKKLRNPYSIEVMKEACDLLYPPTRGETSASDTIIVPNVKYVRFLPADSTEFRLLMEAGLELFNYPLDYEILGDPNDYRDPSIPPYSIQWQYTVMPIDQAMPIDNGEILEVGYIPELDMPDTGVDLTDLEQTAIAVVLEGFINGPVVNPYPTGGDVSSGGGSTSNDTNKPSPTGRITIRDNGSIVGVKSIKIRARNFFKIITTYTNDDGEYYINLDDILCPWFELRFHNKYGFEIGYGAQVIMPMSTFMGFETNFSCTKASDQKSWVACTINNAAYDWYSRCIEEGMPTPPNDLYIWAIEEFEGASCPMLHHGVLRESGFTSDLVGCVLFGSEFLNKILGGLEILIEMVGPDVTVCDVDNCTTHDIYKYVSHELAHATHYKQLGSNDVIRSQWWAHVFGYEIQCMLNSNFQEVYEHPSVPREERAGITEMWAHAVGHICGYEHRQKQKQPYPHTNQYWFAPEILIDLYDGGMTLKQICDCMTSDVVTLEGFRARLIANNSSYAQRINNLFNKYLDN